MDESDKRFEAMLGVLSKALNGDTVFVEVALEDIDSMLDKLYAMYGDMRHALFYNRFGIGTGTIIVGTKCDRDDCVVMVLC